MSESTHQTAAQAFSEGLALHQQGALAKAQALYQRALQIQPDHFDALHLLGVIAAQTQNYAEAIELLDRAIALCPNSSLMHNNRGNVWKETKQYDAALQDYDQAIVLKPDYAEAYNNRGTVLHDLQQYDAALQNYDRALALKPDYAEAHHNRGNLLRDIKQYAVAVQSYDQAIAFRPDYAESYNNRGMTLHDLKQYAAALQSYDQAIALRPDDAALHFNRGNVLKSLKQHAAALQSYAQALALIPEFAEAYNNRGNTLKDIKQHAAALHSFNLAIQFKPDFAEAYNNRGNVLKELNQHAAALQDYNQAIAFTPDDAELHFNLGLCHLLMGNFAEGWEKYEWRWQRADATRKFAQPQWLGQTSLQGKTILLHSEQGLGDTLQFCRYVPMVSALGARIILEIQKPLRSLLAQLDGVAEIIAQGSELPPFDYHCPLLSLPLAFNTDLTNIPAPMRYISSDAATLAKWQTRLGAKTRPRIGLTWSGSLEHPNDQHRSIAFSVFAKICSDDFQFISLQKEVKEADIAALQTCREILHFGDELQDFSDTAALCELVDLVISIDTSVAHLAAAMGKPVWILLPFNPDWRWLLNRNNSPWYPSAKLYRQELTEEWEKVIERVKLDLTKTIQTSVC